MRSFLSRFVANTFTTFASGLFVGTVLSNLVFIAAVLFAQ